MSTFSLGAITLTECWKYLLHPEILALNFPPVPEVDCDNCRMVHAKLFPPHIKCCTYTPEMVNFMVGALLHNGASEHGEKVIADWLDVGRGTPLYLCVPPHIKKDEEKLHTFENWQKCPMYLDGGCSIYEYRPYICSGYHCYFPEPIELYCFWNSLSSLLSVVTAVTSQYLSIELGLDRDQYRATWSKIDNEDDIWTKENGIESNFSNEVWQGLGDHREFYKASYQLLLDQKDTIYEKINDFRKEQLLRNLKATGALTTERQKQIEQSGTEIQPLEPDHKTHTDFRQILVPNFAQSIWTISEHAGFALWYYEQVWGKRSENPINKAMEQLQQSSAKNPNS